MTTNGQMRIENGGLPIKNKNISRVERIKITELK